MASLAHRSTSLLASAALLSINGVGCVFGLSSALAPTENLGEFSNAVRLGSVIGSVLGALLYFGLAYAQWKKGGKWGFAIGLFAILILLIQSGLFYLALHSGRVAPTGTVIARFVLFSVLGGGALAVTSFLSYPHRRQMAVEPTE